MLGGHSNRYLMQDKEEAEQLRLAREIEEEKAMYSVIIFCLLMLKHLSGHCVINNIIKYKKT